MRAATVRIIQDEHIARGDATGVVVHDRLDTRTHRAQMHRHMGRIGNERALRIEDRTGKIEALLDVHGMRRVLQSIAHLLGNRHEQIVEDLQHDRVGLGAHCMAQRPGLGTLKNQIPPHTQRGAPFGINQGGGSGFAHNGRAGQHIACAQSLTLIQRRIHPAPCAEHLHDRDRARGATRIRNTCRMRHPASLRRCAHGQRTSLHVGANRNHLNAHRFDHEPAL